MTEENKPDVAVEFYYRMRAAITGRKDRDTKRREKSQRQGSRPFDAGRAPRSIANTMDELIQRIKIINDDEYEHIYSNSYLKFLPDLNSITQLLIG